MILCSFSCICRLSWACIFRATFTKATKNAHSSLTFFLHCLLQLTVLPLDCYLMPSCFFCPPLSTTSLRLPLSTDPLSSLGPSSPCPLLVSQEISPFGPLCGFCAKTDKEIICLLHTPDSVSQCAKKNSSSFKMLSTKCVYKYIFNIYA